MLNNNVRTSPLDAIPITLLVLFEQSVYSPSIEGHALQTYKSIRHQLPTSASHSLRTVVIIVRLVRVSS